MTKTKTSSEIEVVDDTVRAREAWQLYLSGKTWDQVAAETGYASGQSAKVTVRAIVQRTVMNLGTDALDEILHGELDRLDALQEVVWKSAILGDLKSVDSVLKIMDKRHKLLGFDKREERVTNQTLVVTDENIIETLRQAVRNRDGDDST